MTLRHSSHGIYTTNLTSTHNERQKALREEIFRHWSWHTNIHEHDPTYQPVDNHNSFSRWLVAVSMRVILAIYYERVREKTNGVVIMPPGPLPRGYEEALRFAESAPAFRVPHNSWVEWLVDCMQIIEDRCHFDCDWGLFVGMTAGMIQARGEQEAFGRLIEQRFNRPHEKRFLAFFVAFAHILSGASTECLRRTYRDPSQRAAWSTIPRDIMSLRADHMGEYLAALKPHNFPLPITREGSLDGDSLFGQILRGYVVTTRNHQVLAKYREHRRAEVDALRSRANQALCAAANDITTAPL